MKLKGRERNNGGKLATTIYMPHAQNCNLANACRLTALSVFGFFDLNSAGLAVAQYAEAHSSS